jgi:hypothetical protein
MAEATRRTRVENGVFRRPDGRLEIGWRDAQGRQRWRVVEGGIAAARNALVQERAKRARGETAAADPRLRLDDLQGVAETSAAALRSTAHVGDLPG